MKKRPAGLLKKEDSTWGLKGDKIRVTGFSVSPINPERGKQITIKLTMKNVSAHTIEKVPWQIIKDKKVLQSGARYDVASGDSFKITTTWTATQGSHFFYADADPDNTLNEPKIRLFNNLPQGFDVVVK